MIELLRTNVCNDIFKIENKKKFLMLNLRKDYKKP
jgi:hypothetical protein